MATTELPTVSALEDTTKSLDAGAIVQKIYLAVGICGMIDNIFVALVLLTSKALRQSKINMFIINQSLIDFAASAFIIATNFGRDVTIANTRIGREIVCRIWLTNLPIWGLFFSSTFNIVLMTIDRFSALVYPLTHKTRFTKKRSAILMVFVWFLGPVFNASYIVPTSYMVDEKTCLVFSNWPSEQWQKAVFIIVSVIVFWLPLIIIAYCYIRIFQVLIKSGNITGESTSPSNRDVIVTNAKKNVIKTLAIVSLCFLLCWIGNNIYVILYISGFPVNFNSVLYHMTVVAVFMNSFINPIVYALTYDPFKGRVRYLGCPKSNLEDKSASVAIQFDHLSDTHVT